MATISTPPVARDPAGAGAGAPGLSPEQMQAVTQAHARGKKIRRAAFVASTDAWLMAVFSCLTLMSGVFDIEGAVVGLALAVVTFNSFRGARGIRCCDLKAPRLLAYNQALLAGIVTVYALWKLYLLKSGKSAIVSVIAGDADMGAEWGSAGETVNQVRRWAIIGMYVVYWSLIPLTAVVQGLTGAYYWSRGKLIRAYLAETPAWVVDLHRKHNGA